MASSIDKSIFSSGGKTFVGCSVDGTRLFAVNKHGLTKVLQLDTPEEEPDVLETCVDFTSMAVVSNSKCIVTSFKGDVYLFSAQESENKLLLRCALPVRDVVIVHSGKTVAVGGDDLEVTLVSLADDTDRNKITLKLEDQVRQMSYNQQMSILAISQVNGIIHFYSMTSTIPRHVHRLENCIASHFYKDDFHDKLLQSVNPVDADDDFEGEFQEPEYCDENRACARVEWHPHGLQFAVPCQDRVIKIYNLKEYSQVKSLTYSQIKREYVDLKYSPQSGAFIAAVDLDNRLTIWNVATGEIHNTRELRQKITNICWTLQSNNSLDLHLGTWTGDTVTIRGAAENILEKPPLSKDTEQLQKTNNLFVNSEDEDDIDAVPPLTGREGENKGSGGNNELPGSQGFTDDEAEGPTKRMFHNDEDDFIDDDDGAGYVIKKPKYTGPAVSTMSFAKDTKIPKFRYRPFSPGSTPFGTSDRRYLTMNNIGYTSTVRNGVDSSSSRYTVTTSFFDLGRFKEYHFEDLFGYDICSLTEDGVLFAQSKLGRLHYRAHNDFQSSWNKRVPLQKSEKITSIAATPRRIVVSTSLGYLRTFNQFGIPLEIEKMAPVVAIAAQDYKIFAVHFSPYHGLSYTLFEQNPQTGNKYFQRESSLPIKLPSNLDDDEEFSETFSAFNPLGIKSLFFSAYGDPCIFGADDVLLVLSKYRSAAESRWVPLLDSKFELWKSSNGREINHLHVWPLGLTFNVLNHILVKGHNIWPEFPLPLPSEMEVRIPLLIKDEIEINRDADNEQEMQIPPYMAAEEEFVRSKVMSVLLNDTLEHEGEVYGNETQILLALNSAYDKSLLRLFASACSEQDVSKAVSLAQELKQDKALNAAVKVAERAELMTLVKKVNDIRESRFELQINNI
ncbi:LANO_0H20780g1_1 [Lachancea nothofagi CBS 11611]|uniref:LANO_0H20780g1_1 n=1 Tax=Lachancea nothofagi CBS 11611 TaxID=1266666 RepID=A0A1G4KNN1_9SACH|nr:LANO_0H20780g1_1 [Lachancea nothofagi CBS 11611]